MAERSVSVRLRAEVSGYMAGMRKAGRATRDFANDSLSAATRNRAEFETLGTALVGFGTAVVGGLAMATKAAIDWESAWTGVKKTVDGSAEQMAALEGELRQMARTLPVAHEEIAGVAEAAGQLGIKRQDIAEFSRTMIDLGNTTNLAATDAATAIARFSNVMGTSTSDVSRLGSALVDLGNNSATTEADIMNMASRMAGAGKLIGASESDVLALAAALSSIGIEAEAGGGSMSRVMQQIYAAVNEGGKKVEGFAKVAGMSADQFASAFRENPVKAINEFIRGLNGVEASGGNVIGVLKDIGIRSSEDLRTVLGLKGATDLLSDSLGISAKAWEENTALSDEAQQRYDTAASKIQVAWNQIKDTAITVGGAIAPVVKTVAETVGNLASAFGSLPGPALAVLGVLGGLVGAAALFGGAALLLLPRIADTRAAMQSLGITGEKLRGSMRRTGDRIARVGDLMKTHWKAGLLGAALIVGDVVSQINRLNPQIDAMTVGLEKWASTGRATGEAARVLGGDMEELEYALQAVTSNGFDKALTSFLELGTGLVGYTPFEDAKEQVQALDQALAGMVQSGHGKQAAKIFQELADKGVVSIEQLKEALPGYTGAVEKAGSESEKAGKAAGVAADGIDGVGESAEDAASKVNDLIDTVDEMNSTFFSARNAARGYEEALDKANETIAENGRNLDITTEAGRANEAALDDLAQSAVKYAEETLKDAAANGTLGETLPKVEKRLADQQAQFVKTAVAAGMNEGKARDLAAQLFRIPDNVKTAFSTSGYQNTLAAARNILAAFDRIPRHIQTVVTAVAPGPFGAMMGMARILSRKDGGLVPGYADGGLVGFPTGGMVRGPGGPRTDSIIAALSNGEFVVNAKATQDNLDLLRAINAGAVTTSGSSKSVSGVRAVPMAASGGGGVTVVVNAPNYVGSQADLIRVLRKEIATKYGRDAQKALGRRQRV